MAMFLFWKGDFGGNLDSAGPILGVRTSTSREGAAFFGQHDINTNFTKQKVKQVIYYLFIFL
jgi:hypothetical protein